MCEESEESEALTERRDFRETAFIPPPLPRYVSVVVNVFCRARSLVRSQSSTLTMELMMVIYRSCARVRSLVREEVLAVVAAAAPLVWLCCVRDLHRRLGMTFLIVKGVPGLLCEEHSWREIAFTRANSNVRCKM